MLGDVYFVVLENWLRLMTFWHKSTTPMMFAVVPTSSLTFSDTYTWLQVPRTITDWNKLPENIINSTSLDSFKSSISKLQY